MRYFTEHSIILSSVCFTNFISCFFFTRSAYIYFMSFLQFATIPITYAIITMNHYW